MRISANDMIGKRNAYFYQEYVYVRELGRGKLKSVLTRHNQFSQRDVWRGS